MSSRFLILFEARSGSSLLVSLLNSSQQILCYPEVFANQPEALSLRIFDDFVRPGSGAPDNLRNGDPSFGTDPGKWETAEAIGLKAKFYDLPNLAQHWRKFEDEGVKLVYLYRKNLLKQALSTVTGMALHRKNHVFNAVKADQTVGRARIDPQSLLAWFMFYRASLVTNDYLYETYRGDKTCLSYEHLVGSQDDALAGLARFLDVDTFEAKAGFVKNTLDSLQDAIENYDEVKADLAWTPAGPYFEKNASETQ